MMKKKALRNWMIFWELFIGIGALFGAVIMFLDTSGNLLGMAPMLPFFRILPFADILFGDFLVPGIALLAVNGIPNFTAFWLLKRNSRYAGIAGMVCGVLLMSWICVQFYIFPLNFMSTAYFIFGVLEVLTGYLYHRWFRSRM